MSEEEKKKPEEKKTDEPKTEEKKVEEPKEPPPPAEAEAPAPPQSELVLKGFRGVEDVETDYKTQKVVVKGEIADPVAVLEMFQKNSDRHVELLSPIPKPPAEDPKKPRQKTAVENGAGVLDKSFSDDEVDLEEYFGHTEAIFQSLSSSSKVKGMNFGDFISRQRNVILRLETTKGEEKIAEEKACCMLCFAKLAEGDELLKSVCGCTNDLVHVTCADIGTRKEGNSCNYCGQEVHNEAVTLHREITTTQGVNTEKKGKWAFFTHAR